MSLPNWPKVPLQYDLHRKADAQDWIASQARRRSLPPIHKAQYNPLILDLAGIAALELHCIENGTILTPLGSNQKQHNFFVDCRPYFNDPRVEIGYCDGDKTAYVFVKWNEEGYHGYPATIAYLRTKGARI
jgi:hypothetical protein